MLQAATGLYLWSFPKLIYRSDTGDRKTGTEEWTWMLSTVLPRPLVFSPFPAALPSGKSSSQHLPPCQEPAQLLGGAWHCAVGGGMESWAGPGAVSSCPDTLLQLFKPSFGSAEALQSQPRVLSSHTSKRKGLAPSCCCITAPLAVLWPALLLGHWHYCHKYCSGLRRKQLFGSARVASFMTQDWLYNLQLPLILC